MNEIYHIRFLKARKKWRLAAKLTQTHKRALQALQVLLNKAIQSKEEIKLQLENLYLEKLVFDIYKLWEILIGSNKEKLKSVKFFLLTGALLLGCITYKQCSNSK